MVKLLNTCVFLDTQAIQQELQEPSKLGLKHMRSWYLSVRLVLNVICHTGILYPQHDPMLSFSSMHLFNCLANKFSC